MNRSLYRTLTIAFAGAAILAGCETVAPAAGTKPGAAPATAPAAQGSRPSAGPGASSTAQPMPPILSAEQIGLREGIELYNKGSFNEAIKRLGAPEVAGGSRSTQLSALKYTAFSYCVTSRQTQCRQAFEKAFKVDRSFDLAAGEHGHPLWGPAFARAKKSVK